MKYGKCLSQSLNAKNVKACNTDYAAIISADVPDAV